MGENRTRTGGRASIMKNGIVHRRLAAPILRLLVQGITPEKIALSLAFGIVLGVCPVLGSTTVLCAVAALIFQLNLPAIQLVNYLIYPLQLFFLVPFMRMGEKIFRVAPLHLSLQQILTTMRSDLPHAVATFWLAELHAIAAWLLIGLPAIIPIYFVLFTALSRVTASLGPRGNTAEVT